MNYVGSIQIHGNTAIKARAERNTENAWLTLEISQVPFSSITFHMPFDRADILADAINKGEADKLVRRPAGVAKRVHQKIGVLGANGAGKSSLLKIMAGLDDGYSGEARLTPGFTVGYLAQEPQLQGGGRRHQRERGAHLERLEHAALLERDDFCGASPDIDSDNSAQCHSPLYKAKAGLQRIKGPRRRVC